MKKIVLIFIALFAALTAQAKTLIWATEATYPPFESVNAKGEMVGADIEIAKALCQQMKTDCKFVNAPWDSLIPSLKIGKFDVIWGGMQITTEREKQVDFTKSYYDNPVMFVAKTNPGFTISPEGLKGKTIGVQLGNTMQYYLYDTYGKIIHIKTYGSIQQAFLDLKNGRLDAVLSDQPVIQVWLNTDDNKKHFAYLGKPIVSKKYYANGNGIAVAKGNTVLLAQLNAGIDAMKKSGQLHSIIDKYMG